MAFRIGFASDMTGNKTAEATYTSLQQEITPRRSVVQIYFESRNMTLSYYNDRFDLHCGDMVYVEGKFEGILGCIVEVSYNFKIKLSDYKRVIAVVDTSVHGQFFVADRHFVTFDRTALSPDKVTTWFKAPTNTDDEYVTGNDDSFFLLNDLSGMNINSAVAERGNDYYLNNRVKYICLDGTKGYAIVDGSEYYEVEFEFYNGKISQLVCSCFCSYKCKHEFATMLLLKAMLEIIEKNYADEYNRTNYFAAICKDSLLEFAVNGKENLSFTL